MAFTTGICMVAVAVAVAIVVEAANGSHPDTVHSRSPLLCPHVPHDKHRTCRICAPNGLNVILVACSVLLLFLLLLLLLLPFGFELLVAIMPGTLGALANMGNRWTCSSYDNELRVPCCGFFPAAFSKAVN